MPASVATSLFCAVAIGACGGSTSPSAAKPSSLTASGHPASPKTVTARPLRATQSSALRPGTRVDSDFTGIRVFANRLNGFAIADLLQAGGATYPVATSDGGTSWRTDGPVFHIPAANGPAAVDQAGVAGPRTYFAWCGACNNLIDITPDAGRRWWAVRMPGSTLAVLGNVNPSAGLTAIIEAPTSAANGRGVSLWIYLSTNGRRWTYKRDLNAVS
jgi:hypothetical protein